jgi:hypothetical protein
MLMRGRCRNQVNTARKAITTELADGRKFLLTSGVSYQVADNVEPHRSYTPTGAKLFIVD